MNYCPNCGTKLKPELSYCPSCGSVYKEASDMAFGETNDPEEKISGSYEEASKALDEEAEYRKTDSRSDAFAGSTGQKSSSGHYENRTQSFTRDHEPNYGTGYMETAPKTNVYGIVSLVCGIVGIPLFFLFLIPNILAIVFGIMGLVFAKNNLSGKGTSIAGIILGCIMILFFILIIVAAVSFFSFTSVMNLL